MKPLSHSVWLICSSFVNAILAYPTDLISNDTAAQYGRTAFQTCIGPSQDWWPSRHPSTGELASDCENALFQMVDLQEIYGDEMGSFVYQGINSYAMFLNEAHGSFPIRFALPAPYSHGSCTIVVMMMKMWESHGKRYRFPQLPYVFDHDWSVREVATWMDVTSIAGYIRSTCKGGMGYAILGPKHGLGVAIWQKGSLWDRAIQGYAGAAGSNTTVELDEASDVVAVTK